MLVQVPPQRPEQQEEQQHVQQEQQEQRKHQRRRIILVWVVVLSLVLVVLGVVGLIFLLGGGGTTGSSEMTGPPPPPPDTGGSRYRLERLEHAFFFGPNDGALMGSFGLDANYTFRDNDGTTQEVLSHYTASITDLPMSLLSSIGDPQQQLELCFTNNLYAWQQLHQQQQQQHYSDNETVPSDLGINNTFHLELDSLSNDFLLVTFCVSLEQRQDQSRWLPDAFQPRRYGAAILVANNKRMAGRSSSTSPSSSLLAFCMYNPQHQESLHLSYRSVWQSTTDLYNISGTVTAEGVVSLSSNNNNSSSNNNNNNTNSNALLVPRDEQVLFFSNAQITTTMVGPLSLYLTNRTTTTTTNSEWPQVNASQDIFVFMSDGDGGGDGSFSQRGTFQRRWPHPTVNIADYAAKGGGYWLLWCSDCALTLAIAPLLPVA